MPEGICFPAGLLKMEIACFRMAGRDSEGRQRVKLCPRFFLSAEFGIMGDSADWMKAENVGIRTAK